MMTIVKCKECGKEDIPRDETYVNVLLKNGHWCNGCHQTNTYTRTFLFCSYPCFINYMKKVINGKVKDLTKDKDY